MKLPLILTMVMICMIVPSATIPQVELTPWLSFYVDHGENNYFGRCVRIVGDLNGDGFDDMAIGSDFRGNNSTGYVDIIFGGPTKDDLDYLGLSDQGYGRDTCFGRAIAGIGDVNGDGCDDLAVGAYNTEIQGKGGGVGRVFVYFGGAEMDVIPDVIMEGNNYSCGLGFSVAGAGDVNGDCFPDLIAGAPFESRMVLGQGFAYIYFGGPGMDESADLELAGPPTLSQFGWSVSGARDVDGDGYSDTIVGAQSAYGSGRAYIYLGGPEMDAVPDLVFAGTGGDSYLGRSVAGAGDVNNDGYDDVIVGSPRALGHSGKAYILLGGDPMDDVPDLVVEAETTVDTFGSSVSTAGNLNGDGFDDVVIGAETYSPSDGIGGGKVYVLLGGDPMDGLFDATLYDVPRGDLGCAVSGGGDVNGDGLDDFVAAAPYAQNHGMAYVVLGETFRPSILLAGSLLEDVGPGMRRLTLLAVPGMAAGNQGIEGIDVSYDSMITGLRLHDDGLNGDAFSGDGVFSHVCEFPFDPANAGDYLIELTAVDRNGQASDPWPYLQVHSSKPASSAINLSLPAMKAAFDEAVGRLEGSGASSPRVLFWGMGGSFLKEDRGGAIEIVCIVCDPDGFDDIDRMELFYQGVPTGFLLDCRTDFTDLMPYGGMFAASFTATAAPTEGLYLLEARAFDKQGNMSDPAPYVHLE